MNEPERRHGMIRIHMNSILKALYGNTDYKAMSFRISKEDRNMLEITVSHPTLPKWTPGRKLPPVDISRRYEKKDE